MRASVTRAAEGFDRRAFTVDEILRMQDAGIISEDENFELIEGEIVPMQAKAAHESRSPSLGIERALPTLGWVDDDLSRDTFVSPTVVYPRG